MDELLKLGLNEQEIRNMIQVNPQILELNDEDIIKLLNLLFLEQCNNQIIGHIIIANPIYLSRTYEDVNKLILKLKEIGITRLDVTFESNPWLLIIDDYEIDEFIEAKSQEGLEYEDIIGLIEQGMVE